jgi:hypothetical protein
MRTITAAFVVWSVFTAGCSAASSVDDSVPAAGESVPGTDQGEITPLDVPILRVPGTDIQFPPLQLPPIEDGPSVTPGVTIGEVPSGGDGSGSGDGSGAGDGSQPQGDPITEWTPIYTPEVIVPVPRVIIGNPTCAEAFPDSGAYSFTLEQTKAELKDGTYATKDGALTVTVDFDGSSVDFTAIGTLVGVIVKGGPHAIAYPMTTSSGTDLATPAGEDISHLTFCYLP